MDWLFHGHIADHLKSGLALQYIEQPSKIKGLMENSWIDVSRGHSGLMRGTFSVMEDR